MKPKVGMGITIQVGSDAYPGTIKSVAPSGKSFKFIYDHHAGDPHLKRAFVDKDGKWRHKIGTKTHHFWWVYLGYRKEYRDPSF